MPMSPLVDRASHFWAFLREVRYSCLFFLILAEFIKLSDAALVSSFQTPPSVIVFHGSGPMFDCLWGLLSRELGHGCSSNMTKVTGLWSPSHLLNPNQVASNLLFLTYLWNSYFLWGNKTYSFVPYWAYGRGKNLVHLSPDQEKQYLGWCTWGISPKPRNT